MEITINAAISTFNRFKMLNGYDSPIEVNGETKVITVPYKFDSSTCWNISKNLNILKKVVLDYEDANKMLVTSMGVSEDTPKTDPEKYKLFVEELNMLLEKKIEVKGLLKLKLAGLNLDKNPIQPGIIADLADHIEE